MHFHWWYILIGLAAAIIAGAIYVLRFFSNPENYK